MAILENEIIARRARISEEIAIALKASGLSKKAFAQQMHRQPSEVTKWLSGRHNFTSDLLAEISSVLGTQISGVDTAVKLPAASSVVDGYNSKDEGSNLHDSGSLLIDNIDLPYDVTARLGEKALSMGLTLRQYIRNILCAKADEVHVSAYDFCGIWADDFPDDAQIRALRTPNTIKEL